jgi:hypothetical protein
LEPRERQNMVEVLEGVAKDLKEVSRAMDEASE